MLAPKLSNPTLQYQHPTSDKTAPPQKLSWIRTFVKAGLSLTGLGILSQLAYNSYYSPSHPGHSLDSIAPTWGFPNSETLSESTTFKAAQTFYNVFETKSAFFHSLGLTTSTPFGDLQAFALDGDLKALEQAYSSYTDNQVTSGMKDKLLGRVLRQINTTHKNLTHILKWLLNIGANVNHQEKKTYSEKKDSTESTYTTLLTAFESLDVDLYEHLISKGANAGMKIHTYSDKSEKFDQTSSILESIIKKSKVSLKNPTQLKEASLCPIYKRVIDASLPNIPSKEELNKLRVQLYIEKIRPYFCQNYFTITEQEKLDYESDQLANAFNNWFNQQKPPTQEPFEEDSLPEEEETQIFDTEQLKAAAKKMKQAMDSAQDFISKNAEAAKEKIDNLAQKTSEAAKKITESDAYKSTKDFLANAANKAGNLAADAASTAGDLAANAASKSAKIARDIANSETLENIKDGISNAASTAGQIVADTAKSAVDGTANVIKGISNSDTLASVKDGISSVASTAGNLAADAAKSAADGAANVIKGISNSDTLASVKDGISSAASTAGNLAADAAKSAANGASGAFASVKDGISDAASSLKETAKETVAELTGGSSKDTGLRAKK